jgi:HEAT repeat protein
MEGHCLEALTRMGPLAATDDAIEELLARATKRKRVPITILGKMGATEAVETLLEYVDADSDPALQKVTFRALGEIGDERAVGPLADKLLMDNETVRPKAARALGLIGDTRAIKPLSEALKADENEVVRAQAAWALRQIGTKRALEAVVDHGSDETFIVQTELEKARDALDAGVQTA